MKNTTLTLTFNTERLDALAYHMGKKEADLKEELSDYLQKMYEKYVPQTTREYLYLHTLQFPCFLNIINKIF
uniref:DUF6103 family protein n=1 Tax=Enterocloster bolteae TaxID=208479 RepID=UPI002A7F83CB